MAKSYNSLRRTNSEFVYGVTQFIGSFSKPNSLGLVDGKILQFAKANKFGIRLWSDPIHWVFFQTQFIGFGGWQNLQFAKANKFGIRLWSDPIHWVFFQTQFIGFGGWQNLQFTEPNKFVSEKDPMNWVTPK